MEQIIIDLQEFESPGAFHRYLQRIWVLPDYYGGNLDALYDVMTDWHKKLSVKLIWRETLKKDMADFQHALLRMLRACSSEVDGRLELEVVEADESQTK